MPRYAIIEQSTDLRHPNSKIRFTQSKRTVKEILSKRESRYTYPDPKAARNWHHTFTYIYELPAGWRIPSKKSLQKEAYKCSTPTYPRTADDILANQIMAIGTKIRDGKEVS